MHNEEKNKTRPRGNHGPMGNPNEKPKDLKQTIKKLFSYLKDFMPIIIVALVLAATSSVFSIIGPNKLRDLTDELSKGLIVNKNNLESLSKDISNSLNENNIKEISKSIMNFNLNQDTFMKINDSNEISNSDKMAFLNFINQTKETSDKSTLSGEIINLPSSIQNIILPSIEIDKVIVSTKDRINFIKSSGNIKTLDNEEEMLKIISDYPLSIQKLLLPKSRISGKSISTKEKLQFLNVMKGINKKSTVKQIYSKIDKLPKNISLLVKPKIDLNTVKNISLFLLVIYLLSTLFNFINGFIMATVSNDFAMKLRTKISLKINKLSLKYFDNHSYGDILSRVTNDVDTIGMTMSQSLGTLVGAVTLFIGCIIMMFITNWILAITAILSSLIGFIFMSFILSKSQKYFVARQTELGKLNGHIEEIYSSHNVVKAYNGNIDASNKFDVLNKNVFTCNKMSQFLSGLMPSMMAFIGNFGYVAVCVVGALLAVNGNITFGVIVAFMLYVRLFTSPLSQIAQGMTSIQSTAAAAERVFEFVEEPEMDNESNLKGKLDIKKVKGNIEFKHVKFGYEDDKVIIKDFNCKVKPGQKIAIVGPTGAGKTTLVNLLMKFYNINDGDIMIDGISIKNLKREKIHDLFIMVLQDTWLFNGTIRDNIKYNKKHVSDSQIMEALKTVGVDHFVKSLPKNLDYEITDSDSISAGQKQLLTIARGMIKDAPFLILDEATSSVDTRTEELVQKAMDKLTKGRTSFIIAHRLSTIKNADLILVMNEGNIIEQGNHKELMKKNGFYADLYNSQFKN